MSWDFDDDYNEYTNKDYVEFKCVQFDSKGERITTIQRFVRGEDTEYLPNLLTAFAYFLQGMTFSYVSGVVAVDKNGEDTASSEF
jgi:hypothetical protein